MNRRNFGLALGTVVAGLAAGAALSAQDDPKPKKKAKAAKHDCKGQNGCKAQGGCTTDKHACKGQNDCKGQGGCKS